MSRLLQYGGLFRTLEDRVSVRVQGLRGAVGLTHLVEHLNIAHGILRLPEEGSQDLARSVIQESDQGEAQPLLSQPDVGAPIHLHQLALAFCRHPTSAMRLHTVLPRRRLFEFMA